MSTVQVSITVNGERHELDVEPRLLLVHLLRDRLGLTGTHVGCDTSNCGACTVHLDGDAVKSCTVLAVQADGGEVKTIEGMAAADGTLHPLQEAFWNDHALQCGYCTPGHDHVRRRPAGAQPEPERGGDPLRARGQPVPVHRLPQHRARGAGRRQGLVRGRRRHRGTDMSAVEDTPTTKHVGRSLRRKEDPRLITGRSRYVDDIVLPGTLYVAFVRSPEAHARIVSIDKSAAKARDGVVAVYTGEDMDVGRPDADGVGAARRHRQHARALADRQGQGQSRGRPGRRRRRPRPLRRHRRRRGRPRRVRAAPGRHRPRGGPQGRGRHPRDARHEQVARVVPGRRRPRGRLRRGRRDRRAPDRQPPHRRAPRSSRAPSSPRTAPAA